MSEIFCAAPQKMSKIVWPLPSLKREGSDCYRHISCVRKKIVKSIKPSFPDSKLVNLCVKHHRVPVPDQPDS